MHCAPDPSSIDHSCGAWMTDSGPLPIRTCVRTRYSLRSSLIALTHGFVAPADTNALTDTAELINAMDKDCSVVVFWGPYLLQICCKLLRLKHLSSGGERRAIVRTEPLRLCDDVQGSAVCLGKFLLLRPCGNFIGALLPTSGRSGTERLNTKKPRRKAGPKNAKRRRFGVGDLSG
jgi:hypothetical protein